MNITEKTSLVIELTEEEAEALTAELKSALTGPLYDYRDTVYPVLGALYEEM